LFYQIAFKIILSSDKAVTVEDFFPLNIFPTNGYKWIQDLIAPFFIFMKMKYFSSVIQDENLLQNSSISFSSDQTQELFWSRKKLFKAITRINNGRLDSFTIQINHQTIHAKCSN
jgi:hypothetical protein